MDASVQSAQAAQPKCQQVFRVAVTFLEVTTGNLLGEWNN